MEEKNMFFFSYSFPRIAMASLRVCVCVCAHCGDAAAKAHSDAHVRTTLVTKS